MTITNDAAALAGEFDPDADVLTSDFDPEVLPTLPPTGNDDALPGVVAPVRRERASRIVPLMTPTEISIMFQVSTKTVTRWAVDGRLHAVRTPGGHRRYLRAELTYLMQPTDKNRAHLMADAGTLGVQIDEARLARSVAAIHPEQHPNDA